MLSKEGQEKLAYSLFRAFSKYKTGIATDVPDTESKEPDNNLVADTHTTAAPQVQPEKKITPALSADTAREPKEEPKKFVVKSPAEKPAPPPESTSKSPKDTVTKTKPAQKTPVVTETTAAKPQKDTMSAIKTPAVKMPVAAIESTYVKPQKDSVAK